MASASTHLLTSERVGSGRGNARCGRKRVGSVTVVVVLHPGTPRVLVHYLPPLKANGWKARTRHIPPRAAEKAASFLRALLSRIISTPGEEGIRILSSPSICILHITLSDRLFFLSRVYVLFHLQCFPSQKALVGTLRRNLFMKMNFIIPYTYFCIYTFSEKNEHLQFYVYTYRSIYVTRLLAYKFIYSCFFIIHSSQKSACKSSLSNSSRLIGVTTSRRAYWRGFAAFARYGRGRITASLYWQLAVKIRNRDSGPRTWPSAFSRRTLTLPYPRRNPRARYRLGLALAADNDDVKSSIANNYIDVDISRRTSSTHLSRNWTITLSLHYTTWSIVMAKYEDV